nr:MAG TPA: hypothetical protein [Caudoviricetes sp.]
MQVVFNAVGLKYFLKFLRLRPSHFLPYCT